MQTSSQLAHYYLHACANGLSEQSICLCVSNQSISSSASGHPGSYLLLTIINYSISVLNGWQELPVTCASLPGLQETAMISSRLLQCPHRVFG